MTIENDVIGTIVETKVNSGFPKGTVGEIIDCQVIGNTTVRAYCVCTNEDIEGLFQGFKSEWFLNRDLKSI